MTDVPAAHSRSGSPGTGKLLSKPVVSWALYDLAKTIFSMNIVSFFLSIWVVTVMGQTDTLWARATSISMLAMLLTAPILGACRSLSTPVRHSWELIREQSPVS